MKTQSFPNHLCTEEESEVESEDISVTHGSGCCVASLCCCRCAGPPPDTPPIATYVTQHNNLCHDLVSHESASVPSMPFYNFDANCVDTVHSVGPYPCNSNQLNINNRM